MIDCDIHQELGDVEELLQFVEPAQRDWFRSQGPLLGLPGYSWTHPASWFRQDLAHQDGRPPGANAAAVVREVLDPLGVDIAMLNADDALYVSLWPARIVQPPWPGRTTTGRGTCGSARIRGFAHR